MITVLKKHLSSWPEFYLVIPLMLLALPAAGLFVFYLTGRQPIESMGWIVDLTSRTTQAAFAILGVSICRQAFGHWLTTEQFLKHPIVGTIQSLITFAGLCVLLYYFSH